MIFRFHQQLMVATVVAILATTGCNLPSTQSIDEALQATRVEELSQFGTNQIDILFILADSSSIQDEQRRLVDALDDFVIGLNEIGADFHIGFTTPNVGNILNPSTGEFRSKGGGLNSAPGNAYLRNLRPLYADENGTKVPCSTCQGECVDALSLYGDEPYNREGNNVAGVSFTYCGEKAGDAESYCYIRGMTCTRTLPELEYCATLGDELNLTSRKYVSYADYVDITNPEDELDAQDLQNVIDELNCNAFVGTCDVSSSSDPERGLDAMRIALDPQFNDLTNNEGFLRDDALLLVVFASDDDDCSVGTDSRGLASPRQCFETNSDQLVPVEEYYRFLTEDVKREESQVFAAAIVGPAQNNYQWSPKAIACTTRVPGELQSAEACEIKPPEPSTGACPNPSIGVGPSVSCATPGDRYSRFVRLFGSRGAFGSVCEGNFEPVLQQLARAVRRNIGLNCVEETPAECRRDSDCGSNARCVDAPPPLALIEEIDPDDGSVDTFSCTTAADCPAAVEGELDAVCDRGTCYRPTFPAATSTRRFCSDFEVAIQVRSNVSEPFESYASPGTIEELNSGGYAESRDYDINLYAYEQCPQTGVAYRFLRQPAPDSEVRVIYPISIARQSR